MPLKFGTILSKSKNTTTMYISIYLLLLVRAFSVDNSICLTHKTLKFKQNIDLKTNKKPVDNLVDRLWIICGQFFRPKLSPGYSQGYAQGYPQTHKLYL